MYRATARPAPAAAAAAAAAAVLVVCGNGTFFVKTAFFPEQVVSNTTTSPGFRPRNQLR